METHYLYLKIRRLPEYHAKQLEGKISEEELKYCTSSHIPATAADMIATVHNVVIVPKGKEYNQLVFHCITGVVCSCLGSESATCRKTFCGAPKQKLFGTASICQAMARLDSRAHLPTGPSVWRM